MNSRKRYKRVLRTVNLQTTPKQLPGVTMSTLKVVLAAHGPYEGEDVGSFPDVVTYSFYPTKNMTTTEGGIITTDDSEIAEECRLLRSHWQTEKYYHPSLGLNYRMTDVEAAVGRAQLQKLDGFVSDRRENATILDNRLKDIEGISTPVVPDGIEHSYHQYTILLDTDRLGCTRSKFRETLEEYGVGTAVHYPRPLHEQPGFGDTDVSLPVAEDLSRRVLSLPVYPTLTDDDLERVADGVKTTVRSV